MKKIFISVMALAISAMAMATEEAYVRIRLTGASGASSVVRLTQDNERSAAYENGYDSEKMMYQANSNSVLLYGIVGSQNCEDVVTNQLEGVELGFVTNNVDATGYTLKFENVSGLSFQLYDRVADQVIPIVDNGTYTFDAAMGRVAVNDRFVIQVAAPAAPGICFNYEKLQITGYDGAQVELLNYAGKSSVFVESVSGDNVEIDLQTKGLTADTQYIVKLTPAGATVALEYVIKYKPAVTVVVP